MSDQPVGTWTIIHSDGTSTAITTIRTGSGGTEPELVEDDNDNVLAFVFADGRVRAFPIMTVFEISFVPEEEEDE